MLKECNKVVDKMLLTHQRISRDFSPLGQECIPGKKDILDLKYAIECRFMRKKEESGDRTTVAQIRTIKSYK